MSFFSSPTVLFAAVEAVELDPKSPAILCTWLWFCAIRGKVAEKCRQFADSSVAGESREAVAHKQLVEVRIIVHKAALSHLQLDAPSNHSSTILQGTRSLRA